MMMAEGGIFEVNVNTKVLKEDELDGYNREAFAKVIDILMFLTKISMLTETEELYLAETELVKEDGMLEKQLFDDEWTGIDTQPLDYCDEDEDEGEE